jgi:hypothetical protein
VLLKQFANFINVEGPRIFLEHVLYDAERLVDLISLELPYKLKSVVNQTMQRLFLYNCNSTLCFMNVIGEGCSVDLLVTKTAGVWSL